MLRANTKQKFFELLDRTYFTSSNYSLVFSDDEGSLATITFVPRPEFQFKLKKNYGAVFTSEESPGLHFLPPEEFRHEGMAKVFSAFQEWTDRLYEEYKHSNPLLDEFQALKDMLESKFQEHEGNLELHFSSDELATLRARLDEFDSRLSTLTGRTEEMDQQLAAAHEEIERLKADAANVPRGIWQRIASNKVVSIIKSVATSKEGKEFALEAAKKFLIEGPK